MKWRWYRISRNISRSRRFPSSSSSIATGVSNISHFPSTASTTTVLSEWFGEETIDRSSIRRLQANEALNENIVELCMDEFENEYSPERRPSSYVSATNFSIRGGSYSTETVNASITHFPSTTSSTSFVMSEWLGESAIDRSTINGLKTNEALNVTLTEFWMMDTELDNENSTGRRPSIASASNFSIRGVGLVLTIQ